MDFNIETFLGVIKITLAWLKVNSAVVLPPTSAFLGFYLGRIENRRKEKAAGRSDRISLIKSYKYPLLISVLELEDRLNKIRSSLQTDWLSKSHIDKIKDDDGFAKDPSQKGYFFISTIYLVARYFCYIEIINREVGYVYMPKSREGTKFNSIVSKISKTFQYKEMFNDTSIYRQISSDGKQIIDAWGLHRQFQHSIGESLIVSNGNRNRCMSFREFFSSYQSDSSFRYWFSPIEMYLSDLSGKQREDHLSIVGASGDLRILRVFALQYWVARLSTELSKTLRSKIHISPEKIVAPLPEDVRYCIKELPLANSDRFLGQI